jgi:hypothetical protein
VDVKVQLETQRVGGSEKKEIQDFLEDEVQSAYSYFDIEAESTIVSLRDDRQPNTLVGEARSSGHVDVLVRYNISGRRTAIYIKP